MCKHTEMYTHTQPRTGRPAKNRNITIHINIKIKFEKICV